MMEDNTHASSRWYSINPQLMPVKGIYFFFLAATGDLLPYIPIYMKELGLTPTETGIIYGIMPFICFFVRPMIGVLADKTKTHKLVLMLCTLLTGVFYCLLLLAPSKNSVTNTPAKLSVSLHCSQIDSFVKDCWSDGSTQQKENELCHQRIEEFVDKSSVKARNKSIDCEFKCHVSIASLGALSMCFTDDIGRYNEDSCKADWSSTNLSELTFTSDLTGIVSNKVVGENSTYNGQTCANYDLKNVTYGTMKYWQAVCDGETVLHCDLSCPDVASTKTCDIPVESSNFDKTFWIFMIIYLFCNIAFAPVLSLVDAIAYDILGEKRGFWGFQRLWGTVGFSIFAIGSALVMYFLSQKSVRIDYSVSFYIFFGLIILSCIVTYFLKISKDIHCAQMFNNIRPLFRYHRITAFLVIVTCFGIMNSVTEVFLFWYLSTIGSTTITMGLCLLANCIPEIIVFMFAGVIIKKIGHIPCLHIGLIAYFVRFLLYSLVTNPWWFMPIELLHCMCFALMYAGASSYVSIIAPEGMSATMQGLIGGLYFGFGKGIGSIVTGKLFDDDDGLGAVWTFRLYSFFALALFIIYSLLHVLCFRNMKDPVLKKPGLTTDVPNSQDGDTSAGEMLLTTNSVSNENAEH